MTSRRICQNLEIHICFSVWISTVIFGLYNIFRFSISIDTSIIHENLSPGWHYMNRLKDTSDFEWVYWKNFAISLMPWLLIHACFAELLRQYKRTYLQLWYCTVSFLYVFFNFGPAAVLILLLQPVLYWFVLICKGTSTSIWICSFVCSMMINIIKNLYDMNDYNFLMMTKFNNEKFYMILVATSWVQLRCISISLDSIKEARNDKNCQYLKSRISVYKFEILNILSYTFYLPLLFLGPVILYKDFKKSYSIHNTPLITRIYNLFVNISRYMLWLFVAECCLHFVYFNAIQYYVEIVEIMPNWCLYGGGLWMGLYFYLKYLITYGITGSLVAFDDVTPETPPRCVLRVHLYSQMWKYFDAGLHKFLLRYIYKPILMLVEDEDFNNKSIFLLAVKCFASFVCFIFVFLWHGIHYFIFLWSMLNYLGIVLESVGKTVSRTQTYVSFLKRTFSNQTATDRFHAVLCTPVLIVSALSNFYFFGGMEIGDIFVMKFLNQSLLSLIIMFFVLYCSCRVSQSCANLNARRIKIN